MNVKLTTETARRSALILKETTHVPVLRVLWTQVQMELMLSALTLVRILFFSFAYCSFYRVILLLHKMQTVSFGWGAFFVSNLSEKDVYSSCHERGTKKRVPRGIEPQTFGFRALMLYHWATETPRERGLLRSSYDTRPNLVVVRLVFYCPIYFFVSFYFVLFFSLRASRNCIKFWLLKVKHGFQLSLSFFSGPYFLSMLSIDECFDEIHQCDSLAKCHNTPGNYSCQCPDGYSSQWKDCIGEAGV